MISSLLIANRGEIACRVIRTARRLGIRTVAVYSDADANSLHVRQADEAVHIGPSPARESYLVGDKIIAAAKATGAEAIHPGYGFLSENADFAQAVIDAGLVWVGPQPASIRAMGLKDAAKKLMQEAGVPVTPGYLGEEQSLARLQAEADAIGYPVLIKAVAGGGGKGMRRVESAAEFADMLASCKREAAASFGDDRVLIEKYILSPRHIEVQVFGDSFGQVVHLFERDCSLQRRHQKVIEEAPAPGMDEATREAVCGAAVRAALAVEYEGAGTIEFIADASEGLRADRIWFMEMNTRLQVEHPVTEEITGVDLVEWQLRVASGQPLPKRQDELAINGWAMEARLYAEDPAKGFLPSIGTIEYLHWDGDWRDWYRLETSVLEGDEVTPHYDPMIAKIVVRAEDRLSACDHLAEALNELKIWPVKSNAAFLYKLATFEDFRCGSVDTGLIQRHAEELTALPPTDASDLSWWAQILVPKTTHFGFRLNASRKETSHFLVDDEAVEVRLFGPGNDMEKRNAAFVAHEGRTIRIANWRSDGAGHHHAHDGDILSPMPGKVIVVEVTLGQAVTKGQKLLTLEAMKMEHTLVAPFDGTVAELSAVPGAQVQVEALLARILRPNSEGVADVQ